MRNFETDVQLLKYKVLRAVAEHALNEKMDDVYYSVPQEVIPGKKPTMRCCVYKERAIVSERVHNVLGGERGSNVIQVIDIARSLAIGILTNTGDNDIGRGSGPDC